MDTAVTWISVGAVVSCQTEAVTPLRSRVTPEFLAVQVIPSDEVTIVPEAPTANGILSGKLMEYLGTGRAILVVGPIDGDAAWIVEHTGTGQTAPNDPESLEPLIEQVFDRFLRHQGCPDRDHNRVKQFSRSSQARVLSKFLRRIVDAGGHTRSTA